MYPANELVQVLFNDRLQDAEQARLVRSQKREQPEPVVQLRRRPSWIRALLGRKALAR
jgi:hypothetical protein